MGKNRIIIIAGKETADKVIRILGRHAVRDRDVYHSVRGVLNNFKKNKPDVALVELSLVEQALKGKTGGIETSALLTGKFGIPVVFLTGPGNMKNPVRTLKVHPFGFVSPDDAVALRGTVSLARESIDYAEEDKPSLRRPVKDIHYRHLVESMYNGVGMQDARGVFTFVNERFCKILGYTRTQLAGKKVKEFLDRRNYEILKRQITTRRKGASSVYELVWTRKNGTTVPTMVSGGPLFDEEGKYAGSYGVITDISDRYRIMEALRKSERAMGSIIEFFPDATFVIDREKKVIAWNHAIEEMTGVKKEQIIGKGNYAHSLAFYGKRRPMLIDIILNKNRIAAKFYDSITIRNDTVTAEVYAPQVYGKRGAFLWGTATPLYDESGSVIGAVESIRDISDRKRMEHSLVESEERYRSLVQHMQDGMFVVHNGKLILVNKALSKITGRETNELIDHDFVNFIYPDDRKLVIKYYRNRRSGRSAPLNYEVRLLHKNGSAVHVILSADIISIQDDIATIGTVKDISERKRHEEELRRSAADLRTLFESTDQSFILIEPDYRVRAFNLIASLRVKKITGGKLSEGESILKFFKSADIRSCFIENFRRTLGGESLITERKLVTADHGYSWFELNYSPVFDDKGKIQRVLLSLNDISSRKKAEESVRLNQTRLETILTLYSMIHSRYEEITSFSIENAVSLTRSTMGYLAFLSNDGKILNMHSWSAAALEECKIRNKEYLYPLETTGLWGEAVRQRRPVITNDYSAPNPYKKGYPPGHVKVQRHMNIPIFEGDTIVGVAGVANKSEDYDETDIQQITLLMQGMWQILQRKNYEDAVSRSEESLSTTLASIGEAIIATDTDFVITRMNPVAEILTGWTAAEAMGKPIMVVLNIIDERTSRSADNLFTSILNKDRIERASGTTILIDRYGNKKRISESASPIRDREGSILGIVIVFRDITEKYLLEDQLRQSQKIESIGRLAGGIAHDFNNLLTTIIGNAELAISHTNKEETINELINEIREAGHRGAQLTGQLLAFSRKQVLEMRAVDLNRIIGDLEKILRRLVRENIELVISLKQEIPPIRGDAVQIEQILMNLAANSIDAMPDGGTLTITTGMKDISASTKRDYKNLKPGSYVVLNVTDTGHGMDETTLKNIFDPFFTTKEVNKGTGLGLSMVYGIVQQHEGGIFVRSSPGSGTNFEIYFIAEKTGKTDTPLKQHEISAQGGSETILLVEDNPDVRRLAKRYLIKIGYHVIDTGDPHEAMEIGRNTTINLLLTDIVMPGMNGKQLYDRLKPVNPELRVLFMSGYTDDVVLNHGIGNQRFAFIQKPFMLNELSQKVREAMDL